MWNNGGLAETQSLQRSCKEDLQEVAKRLKKQLDIGSDTKTILTAFVEQSGMFYELNTEERKTVMALIGTLAIRNPAIEREYDLILARIEKEESEK